jgi:hypothetical protein
MRASIQGEVTSSANQSVDEAGVAAEKITDSGSRWHLKFFRQCQNKPAQQLRASGGPMKERSPAGPRALSMLSQCCFRKISRRTCL